MNNECSNISNVDIRELCNIRREGGENSNSRYAREYARWIRDGRAWWFTTNICSRKNRNLRTNCVVVRRQSWEQDPVNYPLPEWWWKYPEIPAPSIQWLSRCDTGSTSICRRDPNNNNLPILRRNEYLPPYDKAYLIVPRINIHSDNWEFIDQEDRIISDDQLDYVIKIILPRNDEIYDDDIETFENVETFVLDTGGNNPNQSWIISSIVVIVVIICLFFLFKR